MMNIKNTVKLKKLGFIKDHVKTHVQVLFLAAFLFPATALPIIQKPTTEIHEQKLAIDKMNDKSKVQQTKENGLDKRSADLNDGANDNNKTALVNDKSTSSSSSESSAVNASSSIHGQIVASEADVAKKKGDTINLASLTTEVHDTKKNKIKNLFFIFFILLGFMLPVVVVCQKLELVD